jgi:hypothetical protein
MSNLFLVSILSWSINPLIKRLLDTQFLELLNKADNKS